MIPCYKKNQRGKVKMEKVDKGKAENASSATSSDITDKCPRVWEKARRDRLKVLYDELSRLLPKYDPTQPVSRPNIIQKAIEHIRDLQAQNEDLLKGGFDQVYKSKLDTWKERVKNLVNRVGQLSDILRTSDITVPPLALEPIPGWAHIRPKHWSNKINLPKQELEQVISNLTKKKQKRSISVTSRKRKIVQCKENQPEISPRLPKKAKKAKVEIAVAPTDEAPKALPIILSQAATVTTQIQPSTQSLPTFIKTNPQSSTFILTDQGSLVPVLTPNVLTPVIINQPSVLLMQTSQPPKPVAVAAKPPPNKVRIDRETTVMTFANKKPIPALSQQSNPRRVGKCAAHKTRTTATVSNNLMPVVCSNIPAVSPTATFLSSFPVVSTPKIIESEPATDVEEGGSSSKLETSVSGKTSTPVSSKDKPPSPVTDQIPCSTSQESESPPTASNATSSVKKVENEKSKVDDSETEVVFTLNLAGNEGQPDLPTSKDTTQMSSKDQNLAQVEDVTPTSNCTNTSRSDDVAAVPTALVPSDAPADTNCSKNSTINKTKIDAPSSKDISNTQATISRTRYETTPPSRPLHDTSNIVIQSQHKTSEHVSDVPTATSSTSTEIAISSRTNTSTYNLPTSSVPKESSYQVKSQVNTPTVSSASTGGTTSTFVSTSNLPTSSVAKDSSYQVKSQISADTVKNIVPESRPEIKTTSATTTAQNLPSITKAPEVMSTQPSASNPTWPLPVATTSISWSSSLPIMSTSTITSTSQNSWLPLPSIYSSSSSASWRPEPGWNPPASQPDPWTIPHHPSVTSVQFSNASTFVNTSFGPQSFSDPWAQSSQSYTYLGDAYTPAKTDSYVSIPNFAVTSANSCVATTRAVGHNVASKSQYTPSSATYTTLNTVKRNESFYVPPLSEQWCVPATVPNKLSTNYSNSTSLSLQKEATAPFLTPKTPLSTAMTLVNSKIDEPWKTPTFVQTTNDQSSWKMPSSSVHFYSSSAALPINSHPPTTMDRKSIEDSSYLKVSNSTVSSANSLVPFIGSAISHLPKNSQNPIPPESFGSTTSHSRKSGNITENKQPFVADSWGNRHPDPFSAVLPQYPQQDPRADSGLQKQSYQYENFAEPYLPNFCNSDLISTPQTRPKVPPPSKSSSQSFPASTAAASHASVTSIHSLLTVSSGSSQTKPSQQKDVFSSATNKPACGEMYPTNQSQDASFMSNFQFVPSSVATFTPALAEVTPSEVPLEAKGLKKEKNSASASKEKVVEKPRVEAKNPSADKIMDTAALWNNQYFPHISGNEPPFVDFTMEPRDSRPKPPVNWMTESDQRTDLVQFPSEDPFQSGYQNVFDRKGHNLLDFLNNPLDHDGGKAKKKEDFISQDYFGWMSMKVDGLVPSTLPTLVGDLALGNEITPTKRKQDYQPGKNKMGHAYQPTVVEKHKMVQEYPEIAGEKMKIGHNYQSMPVEKQKTSGEYPPVAADKPDHTQEPFTNLSKNIFESELNKDSDTIVLKNIFELPTVQPTKQRTNIGQNSFLSVSQLVESNSGQKTQNYYNYTQPAEKVPDWKCAEKKCQQSKSRSNYSAEALLRPETMSSAHEAVPAPSGYTDYSNMPKPSMTARQRKQDYYRGQELKTTAKTRSSKKPQEFPLPLPQHSLPRFSNTYGPVPTTCPPSTFSYSEPPLLPSNTYGPEPMRHAASYPKINQSTLYPPNSRVSTGVPRHKQPVPPVSTSNYPLAVGCGNNARPQQLGVPWTPLAAQPPGSSGSSLANFNLTTIFPEMNKKGYQYT